MGDRTKTAGSLLVMAILGGAALTKVMGMLPSIETAYLVPVVGFAGVALYAWFGGDAPTAAGPTPPPALGPTP